MRRANQGEVVVERGVPWSRDRAGRIHWYNERSERWVLWRPGADAPPLPPGWAPRAVRTPGRRLLLRLIPALIAVIIIVVGVIQATHKSRSSKDHAALVGKCLQLQTAAGAKTSTLRQVACSSTKADLRVVAIVPTPAAGARPSCPKTATGTVGLDSATVACVTKIGH